MKIVKFLVLYMMVLGFVFLPLGQMSKASSHLPINGYASYPMPLSKPLQCISKTGLSYESINQKQAAAAVLALYFGVTHAIAPDQTVEPTNSLCVL